MMEHVMNLGQIDDYIRKMTEDEKSSATIQKYAHDIRCFYQYLDETKRFGKDIVYLADILGHSSINTTRIYTITDAREHEKLISGLGLVQT